LAELSKGSHLNLFLLLPFFLTNQEAALHALTNDASPNDPGPAFPLIMEEGNFLIGAELFGGMGGAKSRRAQVNERSTNPGESHLGLPGVDSSDVLPHVLEGNQPAATASSALATSYFFSLRVNVRREIPSTFAASRGGRRSDPTPEKSSDVPSRRDL